MQAGFRFTLLVAMASMLLMLAACGGNASPRTTVTNPTPTSPSPTPTTATPNPTPAAPAPSTPAPTPPPPPPMPSPSGDGGSGGSATNNETIWQASLIDFQPTTNGRDVHGQVIADADGPNGNGTYEFTGLAAHTDYTVRFCYDIVTGNSCRDLASATTDGSGSGKGSFHITPLDQFGNSGPRVESGAVVVDFGVTHILITAWTVDDSSSKYSAPLYPCGPDPLKSGRATVMGSAAHLEIRGALAKTTYGVNMVQELGVHSGRVITSLTTDSNGDADIDFVMPSSGYEVTVGGTNGGFCDGVRSR